MDRNHRDMVKHCEIDKGKKQKSKNRKSNQQQQKKKGYLKKI